MTVDINPLNFWHNLRVSKTAAIEKLQQDVLAIDATIRLIDIKAQKALTPEGNVVNFGASRAAVASAVSPSNPTGRKRGYKRKYSWEGLDDDIKAIFNENESKIFTINDIFDIIKLKPYYKDISRASISNYLIGLRRADFLEYDIYGRAYMYCKKRQIA